MQLIIAGESDAEAAERRAKAQSQRDQTEALFGEYLVIQELSRWKMSGLGPEDDIALGKSMPRILTLSKPASFAAEDEIVEQLVREVSENYHTSQTQSVMSWRKRIHGDPSASLASSCVSNVYHEFSQIAGGKVRRTLQQISDTILIGKAQRYHRIWKVFDICARLCAEHGESLL
jgi:hypothetical protein